MNKTLLLAPAPHYANEIPLLAAISAFSLIFRERTRPEDGRGKKKSKFVVGGSRSTSERRWDARSGCEITAQRSLIVGNEVHQFYLRKTETSVFFSLFPTIV